MPVGSAQAVTTIELSDHRASKRALDRLQQATDFDEDIRVRRGEQQFRDSIEATRKRMGESKNRLQAIAADINRDRW